MNPVPVPKLQHVFAKHALDFGVTGRWSATNAVIFEGILHDQVNDPGTTTMVGTYRGVKDVTHYYDPLTNRNIMVDTADELESAWR